MLAKGHHWPKMTLVVIVDADTHIYSPDFRSIERFAQQFTQVAGRAGRADIPGAVYLQTQWPKNPIFSDLINCTYREFVKKLLPERTTACLPPYSTMVYIIASANEQTKLIKFLTYAKQILAMSAQNHVISIAGPMPTWLAQVAKQHRMYLIITAAQRSVLQQLLHNTLPLIIKNKDSTIRLILDVDPQQVP